MTQWVHCVGALHPLGEFCITAADGIGLTLPLRMRVSTLSVADAALELHVAEERAPIIIGECGHRPWIDEAVKNNGILGVWNDSTYRFGRRWLCVERHLLVHLSTKTDVNQYCSLLTTWCVGIVCSRVWYFDLSRWNGSTRPQTYSGRTILRTEFDWWV